MEAPCQTVNAVAERPQRAILSRDMTRSSVLPWSEGSVASSGCASWSRPPKLISAETVPPKSWDRQYGECCGTPYAASPFRQAMLRFSTARVCRHSAWG